VFVGDGVISAMDGILDVAEHRIDEVTCCFSTLEGPLPVSMRRCEQLSMLARKHSSPSNATSVSDGLPRPMIHTFGAKALQPRHPHGFHDLVLEQPRGAV